MATVLKVDALNLRPVTLGSSAELIVGDQVAAIGNPLGTLTSTLTVGYVSAMDRIVTTEGSQINMIQTDAAINSGNSGGGMFNTRGELIGIPSLKFSASSKEGIASIEGIAMAIPMDVVKPIVNSIIQHGKVTRPRLGIAVMTMRGTEEPKFGELPAGVYVSQVEEGSPAYRAGLLPDDIILEVDGERVKLHTDLTNRIAVRSAGDTIRLKIYRIPGLANLTFQDRIPAGEMIELSVELEIAAQSA